MYNESNYNSESEYHKAWAETMKSAFWLADCEEAYTLGEIKDLLRDIRNRQPKCIVPLCLTAVEENKMAELIELKLRAVNH